MTIAAEPRPFAVPDPSANALKTGTLADLLRVPEDAAALHGRTLDWYLCHMPQHLFHCWMVEQVSVIAVRIEHNGRMERRMRDRAALRAEKFWDDDRRHEAILLGERLAQSPESIAHQLRRTPQGCDWMIDRWARLARISDDGQWDDAQRLLAFGLLGARPDDRTREIGETIDQGGRLIASLNHPAALARREIAGLLKRKEDVAGLDALDRALARADYVDEPTPEIRRLRRRDAEMHRRLKWYLEQMKVTYPHRHTNERMDPYFKPLEDTLPKPEPEPKPRPAAPAPEALAPEPVVEAEAGAGAEPVVFPAPVSSRKGAKSRPADASRETRRRKRDR